MRFSKLQVMDRPTIRSTIVYNFSINIIYKLNNVIAGAVCFAIFTMVFKYSLYILSYDVGYYYLRI